jgi:hypothetical protein
MGRGNEKAFKSIEQRRRIKIDDSCEIMQVYCVIKERINAAQDAKRWNISETVIHLSRTACL